MKSSINKDLTTDKYKYFKFLLLLVVLIFSFYPPYLKGLYFQAQQLPAEIFVFSAFTCFWIYRLLQKDKRFLTTPLDYASFSFVIIYLLSIIGAAGFHLAIEEWLKYCMYFAVFLMVSDLADSLTAKKAFLWVITASAAGVAILGVDAAAGSNIANIIKPLLTALHAPEDILSSLYQEGRIYSTLQYPNTLAAYLMAAFFISTGLTALSFKLWERILASLLGFILLVVFLLTLSRGAYIIVPVVIIIYFAALPRGSRIGAAALAAPAVISSIAAFAFLSPYVSNPGGQGSKIWLLFGGWVALAAVFTMAAVYSRQWLEKLSWKFYTVLGAGIIIIIVSGVFYVLNATAPLEFGGQKGQITGSGSVKKSIILTPGREYTLVYDVIAPKVTDKQKSYRLSVASRNTMDVIRERDDYLLTYDGEPTNGTERREITFKVPEDSRIINIYFSNAFDVSGVVFNNAGITLKSSDKVEKNIKLKYKYIPDSISARFEDIFATKSGLERAVFYKDGLAIFKDHWFLGAGGGAWQLLNFSYQPYLYWSTQSHNYFIQVLDETGVFGAAVLIFLIAALIFMFIKLKIKAVGTTEEKTVQAILITAIAALLLHSFMDFDFSLSAVFLVMWELAGLINAGYKGIVKADAGNTDRPKLTDSAQRNFSSALKEGIRLHPAVGLIATLTVLILLITLYSARGYADKMSVAFNKGDVNAAILYADKATSLDPLKPEYKIDYANILVRRNKVTQQDFDKANKAIARAEILCNYNVNLLPKIAEYYYFTKNQDKYLQLLDRAVQLRPLRPEEWQNKIDGYYKVGMSYFQKRDNVKGIEYVDKGLGLLNEVKAANDKNMDPFKLPKDAQEMLERMKYIKDSVNTQKSIQINTIVLYGMPGMDVNSDGVPDQWDIPDASGTKLGISDGIFSVKAVNAQGFTQLNSRMLNLEPKKNYSIELELANGGSIKAIPFSVNGTGITPPNGQLKPVDSSSSRYYGEFSTPADFKTGDNVLLLGVIGDYEIKNIVISEK